MVKYSRKRNSTKKRKNYSRKRYTKKIYSKRRKYSKKRKNTKRKQRGGSKRRFSTPKKVRRAHPAGRTTARADGTQGGVGAAKDLRPGVTRTFGRPVSPPTPRGRRQEPGGQAREVFPDVQGAATVQPRFESSMDMDPTRVTTGLGNVMSKSGQSTEVMASPTLGGVSGERNVQTTREANPLENTRRHFEGTGAQSTEEYDSSGTGMRHFETGLHARTDTLGQQTSMNLETTEPSRADTGGAAGAAGTPLYSGIKAVTPRSAFQGAAGSDLAGYDPSLNTSGAMSDVLEGRKTVGEESAHASGVGAGASGTGLKRDTGMNIGFSGDLAYNFLVNQVQYDPQVVISQSKDSTGRDKIIQSIRDTEGGSHVLNEMAKYPGEILGGLAKMRNRHEDYDAELKHQRKANEYQKLKETKKDWTQFKIRPPPAGTGEYSKTELKEEEIRLQIKKILVAHGSAEDEDAADKIIGAYIERRPDYYRRPIEYISKMLEGVKKKYPEATRKVMA